MYTLSWFYSHKLQRETFFKCTIPPSPTRKMNPDCNAVEFIGITNIVITDIGIKRTYNLHKASIFYGYFVKQSMNFIFCHTYIKNKQ